MIYTDYMLAINRDGDRYLLKSNVTCTHYVAWFPLFGRRGWTYMESKIYKYTYASITPDRVTLVPASKLALLLLNVPEYPGDKR